MSNTKNRFQKPNQSKLSMLFTLAETERRLDIVKNSHNVSFLGFSIILKSQGISMQVMTPSLPMSIMQGIERAWKVDTIPSGSIADDLASWILDRVYAPLQELFQRVSYGLRSLLHKKRGSSGRRNAQLHQFFYISDVGDASFWLLTGKRLTPTASDVSPKLDLGMKLFAHQQLV